MRVIEINTDTRKFFKQYLTIIKPLLVPRISNGELNVLAELLYLNHKYRTVDVKVRGKLIFDYDNKIDIVNNLNTSLSTVNNAISSLRKSGYIIGYKIKDSLVIDIDDSFKIGFKFNIENER